MVTKHISRDWTGNRKDIIRPDEYIMFECFSYDHYYTKPILCDDVSTRNAFRTSLRSYTVLGSEDKINDFHIHFDYTVPTRDTYRVDLLYEQTDMESENDQLGVTEDLVGSYTISSTNYSDGDNILFDGEIHYLKRITLFFDLDPDTYHFDFEIPPNCLFIGAIVRKIIKYWGDNIDTAGTNLQFTKADFSLSDMCKSSELTVTIGYDDALEYPTSPSGFYIDYMDECNLYIKDLNGNIIQPFGGYVSSIQEDDDRTKLTIHCADRLQGGENKYLLIQIVLNGGTTSLDTNEFIESMERDFTSYAHVLDYLCSCYEVTLDSNIDENYLVGGEKFHEGFIIDFGSRNEKNKVTATNGSVTPSRNFVTLRNNAAANKVQIFSVFDYKNTSQQPILLNAKGNDIDDNYGWMHITYGMGEAVTETEKTEKNKVTSQGYATTVYGKQQQLLDEFGITAEELAKSLTVSYGKCGVDQQTGTTLMAIGWISHGHSYPSKTYYKALYENYCPRCKRKGTLIWNWRGKCWGKKNVPEGEINCDPRKGGCGADFSIPDGNEKWNPPRGKLTKVAPTVKSNKKELNKLLSGQMVDNIQETPKVDEDDVFKNIAKICNKYKYDAKSGSTASYLQKHHKGDSFAFSDLIFQLMTKWGIQCKIVQDAKGKKRSVLYKNKKNEWVNFPYRKYNFNSKLSAVSNAKTATVIKQNNVGGNISQIKELTNKTKVETTKKTYTYGYDTDKPFKAYLRVGLSTSPDENAQVYYVYPSFTLDAKESTAITGLDAFWINNATRESTIIPNIVHFVKNAFPEMEDSDVYLRTVDFITPTSEENWYTSDGSVVDESSCKLNLYQIVFNNYKGVSPSDLNCCGKNLNDVFTEIVADADYVVFMDYATHRCDDKINFNVVDQSSAKFRAEEGKNNNILKWGNINYTPVSKLFNKSVVVYKSTDGMYYYVDTSNTNSILNYEEQISLQSETDVIGEKQAYYVARNNNDYNPNQSYTYSITVPGYPDIHLKDLVQVVSDKRKLNAVEVLEAISISYDINQIPRIQTELSLGELPDEIMISNSLKRLREANKPNTIFGTTASANTNKSVYTWDK